MRSEYFYGFYAALNISPSSGCARLPLTLHSERRRKKIDKRSGEGDRYCAYVGQKVAFTIVLRAKAREREIESNVAIFESHKCTLTEKGEAKLERGSSPKHLVFFRAKLPPLFVTPKAVKNGEMVFFAWHANGFKHGLTYSIFVCEGV